MRKLLKTIVKYGISKTGAGKALLQCNALKGYLRSEGWLKSYEVKLPVAEDGSELPWYTYSAIHFLNGRIAPGMEVFEWGSGNSTLWWAKKGAHVVSYEHDLSWYTKLKGSLPHNVRYVFCELQPLGEYCLGALECEERFHVIVIDGRDRVNCAKNSINALREDGVILWDNSERLKYNDGYLFLQKHGFLRLDFHGIGPVNADPWLTSVFYRSRNCLGI